MRSQEHQTVRTIHRFILWIGVFVSFALVVGIVELVNAESLLQKGRAILILDASGSMAAKVHGVPKITIARKVVANIVRQWDPQIHLGLTVYGHRRKNDCSDIEAVIPPGPVQPSEFITVVNRLNPKGMTPLSQSVIEAAESLHYKNERSTIVLVTDGEETCHLDPCQVARDLKANGIDFTVHVIGFNVKEEKARLQLRCLAENTGGTFKLADDEPGLTGAIQEAFKSMWIHLEAPQEIFSGIGFNVQWQGPNQKGDQIGIVPEGTPDAELGTHVATAAGAPAKLTGPNTTGPHEIRYVSGPGLRTLLRLKVNVRGAAASIEAPDTVPAGTDIEIRWTGPNAAGDRIVVVKADEVDGRYGLGDFSASTDTGNPTKLKAYSDPGEYEVRYLATEGARVLARRHLTILSSGATVQAPSEVEAGAEFDVQWSGPNSEGDRIAIVEASTREGSYLMNDRLAKSIPTANPVRLTALSKPGDYEVRYIAKGDGKTLAHAQVRVSPSKANVAAPARVPPESYLEVRWSGPNSEGDRVVIVKASAQEGTYFLDSSFSQPTRNGNPVKLKVPHEPGPYEVRYMAGINGATLARIQVDVTAVP
jgi:Ca-activated chloride channel homolog